LTDLTTLNDQQRIAVLESINHNVVLMAAAGSGKTSTLVKRTQYLIDDLGVKPENIMMITFTNKAAGEIKDRVMAVSSDAYKMWIGTFHRICTRLIRMFGNKLGIQNFTIMDTKESKALVKEILDDKGVEYTPYLVSQIITKISTYKNNLIKPAAVLANPDEKKLFAAVYQDYQNISWRRKSFDFDDLIIYTILLLSSYPDVLQWVHDNIKYLMVDETQDTNSSQFQLIKLLAGNNNIMMVGDSNQSIYAFRNAKPQYLENFAATHPNTIKLKLEQNYRSTKTIIQAANQMINHNVFGTKVQMFCANEEGEKIQILEAIDAHDEARWIASEILMSGNKNFSDYAVIYRANFQSRILEEEFTKCGIGYTVFGSQSFYSRKEVRDLLAYCKLVVNPYDIESFKRILGTLKGVGKITIDNIVTNAQDNCINFHDAINAYLPNMKAGAVRHRLETVSTILNTQYNKCSDIINDVLFLTEYRTELTNVQTEETEEKLAIIDEFLEMTTSMEANAKDETMAEIIDQIALLSDTKGAEKEQLNAVKFMTAHASKGLEFKNVFIVGAEEGLFPHTNALNENTSEAIEEERRLFYVAMTRAKKKLYITRACQKRAGKEGGLIVSKASRFLREIPRHLTEETF
jgi:DNA helicase-2/ATP-dependent DNA helicase PcrA